MNKSAGWTMSAVAAGVFSSTAWAGIYSGPTDTANAIDGAIPSGSGSFVEWADAIDASRTAFAPRGSTTIDETGGFNSLGDLDETEIANGDSPGFLTVTFPTGIRNGSGADFAVFESGFVFGTTPEGGDGLFAEFAFVEVSSNGTDFARFASISTNTAALPGGFGSAFSGFDVTSVFNLAGKHASGFGTPFDLDDLLGDPAVVAGDVDVDDIQFVRLVDIPGNGSFVDSLGNPILDNWLTTGTGGFDFRLPVGQGVGVINAVPEPAAAIVLVAANLLSTTRRRVRSRT
ncbi:MAG: PEP-CTERM sorting domain-containing protein [Planctomycetota bacterium]